MEQSEKAVRYETSWPDGVKVVTIIEGGKANDMVEWPAGHPAGQKMHFLETRALTGLELLCLREGYVPK